MPVMDTFAVVEVVQGRLKATGITVCPMSARRGGYPRTLAEGDIRTLRLTLSDESLKPAVEIEQKGYGVLVIDANELEEISRPLTA
jgi:hypothetical protein